MKIDFDKVLDSANIASTAIALKSDFSLYLIFFFRLLYGTDFTFLPFHKKICEALESYVFGTNKKKNLVISMSPRSGKSVIMQFFITWGFIHNPKSNFIFTSYQEQVCNRTSDDILAIMRHPVWQKMFGVKLSSTTQAKELWETAAKGGFRSAPIESALTSFGAGIHGDEWGGCVVIDDALNPLFFNSEIKKRIVKESYETVFSKRLNNPTKTPIIIIMQRVAVDDLVGYVLEKYKNDFEVIKVPALDDTVNPPRSFWESQFPAEMLIKEQLANPAVFAAQRQQEPVLYNGNMFKAEWFKFYHYVPGTQYREVFMASDTAFRSSETADNTAIGLWGRTMDTNRLHLIDLLYGKISSEELVRKFMTFYRTWNGRVGNRQRITSVWIEDAASGMRLIEDLRRLGGIPVRRFKPRGRDKMMRILDMKPMIESGNILFPENASHRVSQLVMKELLLLTEDGKAKHDDIADMIAQAAEVAYNRRGGF